MQDWVIDPDGSSIVVEARSSMGPIAWEVTEPEGSFRVAVDDGQVALDPPPEGELVVRLDRFASGNALYDAELAKRLDSRRFPQVRVRLLQVAPTAGEPLQAQGEVTLHGVTRPLSGVLEVEVRDDGAISITGRQKLDIREFGIPAPQMLMLKIFPDVHVHLFLRGTMQTAAAPA